MARFGSGFCGFGHNTGTSCPMLPVKPPQGMRLRLTDGVWSCLFWRAWVMRVWHRHLDLRWWRHCLCTSGAFADRASPPGGSDIAKRCREWTNRRAVRLQAHVALAAASRLAEAPPKPRGSRLQAGAAPRAGRMRPEFPVPPPVDGRGFHSRGRNHGNKRKCPKQAWGIFFCSVVETAGISNLHHHPDYLFDSKQWPRPGVAQRAPHLGCELGAL